MPQLLRVGELVGVVFAAIVLIIMLGSLVAASLPIVTALVGVGVGLTASLAFSGVVDMASVTPVLGLMLGLAVGIDYSLFIINRHRKQLLAGVGVRESIGLANGTAGTAVVFAGSTVIVALLALNVTGIPFLGLMGTVGAVCVAVAVLIAITVTPGDPGAARRTVAPPQGSREHRSPGRREARSAADVDPARDPDGRSAPSLHCWSSPSLPCRCGSACPTVPANPKARRLRRPSRSSTRSSVPARTVRCWSRRPRAGRRLSATISSQPRWTSPGRSLRRTTSSPSLRSPTSDDNTLLAFQVLPAEGPNSVSTEKLVQDIRALPPVDGDITSGVAGQAATQHRHLRGR